MSYINKTNQIITSEFKIMKRVNYSFTFYTWYHNMVSCFSYIKQTVKVELFPFYAIPYKLAFCLLISLSIYRLWMHYMT